jgi:hypothetical protein
MCSDFAGYASEVVEMAVSDDMGWVTEVVATRAC